MWQGIRGGRVKEGKCVGRDGNTTRKPCCRTDGRKGGGERCNQEGTIVDMAVTGKSKKRNARQKKALHTERENHFRFKNLVYSFRV